MTGTISRHASATWRGAILVSNCPLEKPGKIKLPWQAILRHLCRKRCGSGARSLEPRSDLVHDGGQICRSRR